MKKSVYYILAVLCLAVCIISACFMELYPVLTVVMIVSVPASLLFLILGLRAGKKDGDIPFVGY
ncbi:MAG: hypothetical protein Q4Q53_05400 [Methanocorpusculum sp.]|nr:hypothetical protein [Methanocorpusculum sp.]